MKGRVSAKVLTPMKATESSARFASYGKHGRNSMYHAPRNKGQKDTPCNQLELLKLISSQMKVQPNVHPLQILKWGGFKIKGLRPPFSGTLKSLVHRLAYNDYLGMGICLSGWKGEQGWSEEMTTIQHKMHIRRTHVIQDQNRNPRRSGCVLKKRVPSGLTAMGERPKREPVEQF